MTPTRRLRVLLLGLVAAPLAMIGLASPAAAHAGAIGGITRYSGQPPLSCGIDDGRGFCYFFLSGWAYNAHTKPVQTVKLHFYVNGKYAYGTGQITANESDATDAQKHKLHTNNVGWGWIADYVDSNWHNIRSWTKACAWAHDKGETNGWVSIGCTSFTAQPYYH